MDDGAIGIELGGGVAGVVGKLLDQEFVGVAEFVLGDVGHRQDLRREMLDQVLERLVGQALTVGPGRIAEDAGKKIGVGSLQLAQRGLDGQSDILGLLADIVPVCAFGDLEAVILGELGEGEIASGIGEGDHPLHALPSAERAHLEQVAGDCADCFQRSSSGVAGRNGQLALHHHGRHRLSDRKLAALTAVHNYHIRRADGTTAAERFFGRAHETLFAQVLQRMPLPPRPACRRPRPPRQPYLMPLAA